MLIFRAWATCVLITWKLWFYVVITKKRFGAAQTVNLGKVAECSEVALFEKTFLK